jgi:hypothetical protein
MTKTKWNQAKGYFKWAKVFEENRDKAENTTHPGVKATLEKAEGIYSVQFYPETEEVMEKMLTDGLSDTLFGGNSRFKQGDEDLGCGYYTEFKRKHVDPSGYDDFGGAPEVVAKDSDGNWVPHTYEDGEVWNGSYGVVKYTHYGEGTSQTVRLVKIGVLEFADKPELELDEDRI